ncbi:MAG: hypothetical protein ACE5FE_07305 [Acidiferrobacterales bacterium]
MHAIDNSCGLAVWRTGVVRRSNVIPSRELQSSCSSFHGVKNGIGAARLPEQFHGSHDGPAIDIDKGELY